MTEEHRCRKCGDSFDSERGLSVHRAQVHEGEKDTERKTGKEKIELGVRTAMFGVFALGIFVGLSAGLVFSEVAGQEVTASSIENLVSGNKDGGSGPGDAEAEISGDSTMGALKDIASSVGLDGKKLESCVNSANSTEINGDKKAIAEAVGGLGTPTFFIGNSETGYERVRGAQPYSRMKTTIESKLEEAKNGGEVGEKEYRLENITVEDEPTLGEKSAPINIIEYSDYGCPWCAEWHGVDAIPPRPIDRENSFRKVRENFVQKGKVRFVAKDYPVPQLHRRAMTAHKAANCVWESSPEKFWKFSESLYEHREKWKG